jgi:branched-chain amino acid transport system substrate-binding protein
MLTRRSAFKGAAGAAAAATLGVTRGAYAADQVVNVGINLSFTGADSEAATRVANGAVLAFEEANKAKEVKGITFNLMKYDDGTATAGQYDPAQAATNARKMVSDKGTVAALGPMMSGAGKAMSPILSAGDLATITPSSTNPDITDPKFAAQYRLAVRAVLRPSSAPAISPPSPRPRPIPTSPIPSSRRSTARTARRSISAPSPPTPSKGPTWPTT